MGRLSMCGLVGIFKKQGRANKRERADVVGMMASLVHRGPDSAGTWCQGPLALGHQRLAILDVSENGHQPMVTPDGQGVLALNGEIYSFQSLRAELETLDATTQAALAGLKDVAIIATHPRYQYFAKRYGLTVSALEWEAGAAPNASEVADLAALMEQTGAQMLIWEAAPPAEALAMASDLGLKNIVFPPLAQSVDGRDYLQVFEEAVAKMSEVNTQ